MFLIKKFKEFIFQNYLEKKLYMIGCVPSFIYAGMNYSRI